MGRMRLYATVFCGLAVLSADVRADDWPQFRGPRRDNISREVGLLRTWPEGGPKVLWSVDICQGYAAAAVHSGRVYFNDYNQDDNEWYVRCLRLDDGTELWRFTEAKRIRPNHGITRTVPAVDGSYVFSLDPKCVFHCLDAKTGDEVWRKSLVQDYQARIPPWYNGQCPLIEPDRVIIAPGGSEALMVALKKDTGEEIWRTPNPEKWPLSHSSVMPAEIGGVRQYLWCTLLGPLGVSAESGELLWFHPRKFNVAVSPSPLAVSGDRVFMTGPYDAGSVMVRVRNAGGRFTTEAVFDWTESEWNSEVHTPIVFEDHMLAVGRKKRGLLTCLDLNGNTVWTSEGRAFFGLGSFILADGLLFILEGKTGMLRLVEANTSEYRELASAQVLSGHDVWGPMALSDGKLIARDMRKMVCLEVGRPASARGTARPPAAATGSAAQGSAPGGRGRGSSLPAQEPDGWSARSDTRLGIGGCAPPKTLQDEVGTVKYKAVGTISGEGSAPEEFSEELRGLAIDSEDRLYAVGDSVVKVFSPDGKLVRSWATGRPGYSVAVAADGTVYVGQAGQVELFDRQGKLRDTWSDADRLGLVTAIAVVGETVLLADTQARCIRRYDRQGKYVGDIGNDNRMHGFQIPNRHVDLMVDSHNVIHAPNPGRHRVERYALDGKLLGTYGRFGGQDLSGFSGCCNPTNIALTPGGRVVVSVKADPHVKVFDAAGEKLLAIVGRDTFDPNCANMDVAVDSKGRIYVVDTVRRHIRVFAPDEPPSATQPADSQTGETVRP